MGLRPKVLKAGGLQIYLRIHQVSRRLLSCVSLEKRRNKVTKSTLNSFKAKRVKIGYTFHLPRIPPFIIFKMCNPFYIGLKLPNVYEALWNRMV